MIGQVIGVGYRLNKRYRLVEPIAAGAMGDVWRGVDDTLGREVAVKLLKPEYSQDATFRARFAAEAQHAAALQHPGVAQVFDAGEAGDGQPYLVMELVRGEPLSRILSREGALHPDRTAGLVAQACDAVAAAHAEGIVHRDLKPGNLLVTPEGRVKVTDFGISRAAGATPLTQTGQVIGTAHYMAPETAQGEEATSASDIYSLGVVLYECLTGQRPFERENAVSVAMAHVREEAPPLPPEVPQSLRTICARAMAKDSDDRYPSASDMGAALRTPGTGTGTAIMLTPAPVTEPAEPERNRWYVGAAVLTAAIVVIAIAAAIVVLSDDDPSDTATPQRPGAQSLPSQTPAKGKRPADERRPSAKTTPEGDRGTRSPHPDATGPGAITVVASDYIGRPWPEVEQELKDKGLKPHREEVDGGDKNTVRSLTPTGTLPPDSEVIVYVWKGNHGRGKGHD